MSDVPQSPRRRDRRPVQLAALASVLVAFVVAPALPYGHGPDDGSGDAADAAPAAVTAPPRKRIVGPKTLPAPQDAETAAVVAAGEIGPIRHGGGKRRLVALTFDDGPGPFTGPLLAVLRRTKTPATFFQVGKNLDENPLPARATALLDRVEIADHTYTHHSLLTMTYRQQQDEVISTAASMTAHDEKRPRLFRPPYGAYNQDTLKLMKERGMAMILWSVDSEDYTRPGVDAIVRNVMAAVQPGSIVLMHDGGGDRSETVKAVPKIVKKLRAMGYGLVTVPELLEKDPPRAGDQDVQVVPPGAGQGAG